MIKSLIALICIFFIPLCITIFDIRQKRKMRFYYQFIEGMPKEICESSVFLNEEDIECTGEHELIGRVDQVFQKEDGTLIIMDTKTRKKHKVYDGDIFQLSLYKYILEQNGHTVSKIGYIRTVKQEQDESISIEYNRCDLLSTQEVLRKLKSEKEYSRKQEEKRNRNLQKDKTKRTGYYYKNNRSKWNNGMLKNQNRENEETAREDIPKQPFMKGKNQNF